MTPWWANVAIQGHAVGLLAGIFLGAALAWRRDEWPSPLRLWFAVLAFAAVQGLWAVYAPLGGGVFVMFRWIGTALVFVLGTFVVVASAQSARALVSWSPVDRRTAAWSVLAVVLVLVSVPAVVYNVAPINEQPAPEPNVQVGDYTVAYAEDVEHGYASAVSVPFDDDTTSINASGVIVASSERYVWLEMVTPAEVRNRGRVSVLVGGANWRERVEVNRTGWSVAGNDSVYKVFLRPESGERTLGYTSGPSRAEPVVAGNNVTLRPTDDAFEFVVSRGNRTVATAPMPANGTTNRGGGLAFQRVDDKVFVVENDTRVPVAVREED